MLSLLLASLILGGLLLVNLDRAIHATEGLTTSEHGWPLIYLSRTPTELNIAGVDPKPYAWPWPAVPKEHRVFSWMHLTTDLIVGVSILIVSYIMARTILERLGQITKNTLKKTQ